jgi:hypothetical protein
VYKGTSPSIRRLLARRCILEALDDGRLAAAVVANDDSYWREELDDGDLFVVERPNPSNSELVEARHSAQKLLKEILEPEFRTSKGFGAKR